MRRLLISVAILLMALYSPVQAAGTVSGLPVASEPLGNIPDAVLLDQGTGCPTQTLPCTTSQVPSLRVGQPFQGPTVPTSPFKYQQWWNTFGTPTLQVYDGSQWENIGVLDPVLHTWTPSITSMTNGSLFGATNFYDSPLTYPYSSSTLGSAITYMGGGVTDPSNYTEVDVALGKTFDILRWSLRNNGLGQLNGIHLEIECGPNTGAAAIDCAQGVVIGAKNQGAGILKPFQVDAAALSGSTGPLTTAALSIEPQVGTTSAALIQAEQNIGTASGAPYGGIASIIQQKAAGLAALTVAQTAIGSNVLTFAVVPSTIIAGETLEGPSTNSSTTGFSPTYFPAGTIINATTSTTVTLSQNAIALVPIGTSFTSSVAWAYGLATGQDIAVANDWLHVTMDPSFGSGSRVLRVNGLAQNGAPILAEIDNQVRFRTTTGYYVGSDFTHAAFRFDNTIGVVLEGGVSAANLTVRSGAGAGQLNLTSGVTGATVIAPSGAPLPHVLAAGDLILTSGVAGATIIGPSGVSPPGIVVHPTGAVDVQGTATNDNALAGIVGEIQGIGVLNPNAISMSTNTAAQVTSLSLTAGDWDVWGQLETKYTASTNFLYIVGKISTTTAECNDSPVGYVAESFGPGSVLGTFAVNQSSTAIPTQRLSLASTTTVYLNAQMGFNASTAAAYGSIFARRVR